MLQDNNLLDATARAIARHGLAGATLERIAGEAGLSRVTLHRRGIGKPDLLAGLAARAQAHYRTAMWPVLTADGTGAARLRIAFVTLCSFVEDHLALADGLGSGAVDEEFHEDGTGAVNTRTVWTEPLERLLRDGAQDGTLRPVDPLDDATVLFNLVAHTYAHLRTGHRWTPQRARDATIDIALYGVADD